MKRREVGKPPLSPAFRSPYDSVNGGKAPPAHTNQTNRVEFWQWPMDTFDNMSDSGLHQQGEAA